MINLLGQFADDMDIYLLHDEKSINEILRTLNFFQSRSGFTVSYDKTQIYRIGSLKKLDAKFYTSPEVRWTNQPINVLEVIISHEDIMSKNYDTVLNKVSAVLKIWSKRSLSLMGKVPIVNSLTASLFVYKMMVLPLLTPQIVQRYEGIITNFLWNGRRPKIALKMLQNAKRFGGLSLVDIK